MVSIPQSGFSAFKLVPSLAPSNHHRTVSIPQSGFSAFKPGRTDISFSAWRGFQSLSRDSRRSSPGACFYYTPPHEFPQAENREAFAPLTSSCMGVDYPFAPLGSSLRAPRLSCLPDLTDRPRARQAIPQIWESHRPSAEDLPLICRERSPAPLLPLRRSHLHPGPRLHDEHPLLLRLRRTDRLHLRLTCPAEGIDAQAVLRRLQ